MYHVSAQGVDECVINVHYYYYVLVQPGKTTPNKRDWSRGEGRPLTFDQALDDGRQGGGGGGGVGFKTKDQTLSISCKSQSQTQAKVKWLKPCIWFAACFQIKSKMNKDSYQKNCSVNNSGSWFKKMKKCLYKVRKHAVLPHW